MPPTQNPFWSQATWFIDPQNSSGLANDHNTGLSSSTPLVTWAELIGRMGTTSPYLGQVTTFTLMGGQTAGVDPIFFLPRLSSGSQAILLGTLATNGSTFSPASVTAKNRSTPQLLVLNTVPGGVVAKNLVFNVTKSSYAFVDSVSGGNATMSQPVAASSITTVGIPTLTEDTTWASTDTYQAYTLPLCNLKAWRPQGGDLSGGSVPCAGWVQFVEVVDSSGSGLSETPLIGDAAVTTFSACRVDTRIHVASLHGRGSSVYAICCDIAGQVVQYGGSLVVFGGVVRSGISFTAGQMSIDGDCTVHSALNMNGSGLLNIGTVYGDGSLLVQGGGVAKCNQVSVAGPVLWGSLTVTVDPGSAYWNASGTTFALSLLTSGALKLGANTTGYGTNSAGIFTGPTSITPAALDTASGLMDPITGARFCLTTGAPTAGGTVPVGSLAPGTADQLFDTNHAGTAAEWFTVGGDLTFVSHAFTVVALQGFGVATSTPTSGQVLTWNSGTSKWTATTGAGTSVTGTGLWYSASGTLNSAAVTLSGDVTESALSGSNVPLVVVALQGFGIATATPTSGQVLTWNSGTSKWTATAPPAPTGTGIWYSSTGTLNAAAITLNGDVSEGALSGSNVPLTVVALQGFGIAVAAPTSGQVLTWNSGTSKWTATTPGAGPGVTGTGLWYSASGSLNSAAITLSGDVTESALSGSNVPLVVVALQGFGVATATPTSGQVLTWNSGTSKWTATAVPTASGTGLWYSVTGSLNGASVTLNGDVTEGALSGSNVPLTVVALQGFGVATSTPTSGQVLTWNSGTSKWTATTPGAGPGVTGTGLWYSSTGTLNGAAITLSGDVTEGALSGSNVPLTVTAVHGSTVPAGGALTTGNVLQVTGASALGYAAVNLAGGGNFITGQLPVGNLANGTAAQVLVTNSGATAPAWVSVSGDTSITAAGVTEVLGLEGHTLPGLSTGFLEWTGAAWAFGTVGATGASLVISVAVGSAASYSSTATIPSGAVVEKIYFTIGTGYPGGTTVEVGQTGSAAAFLNPTNIAGSAGTVYEFTPLQSAGSTAAVLVTFPGGAPGSGAATMIIRYATPLT